MAPEKHPRHSGAVNPDTVAPADTSDAELISDAEAFELISSLINFPDPPIPAADDAVAAASVAQYLRWRRYECDKIQADIYRAQEGSTGRAQAQG